MLKRKFVLFSGSLTVCCVLYFVYSLILVPKFILPKKTSSNDNVVQTSDSGDAPAKLSAERYAKLVAPLFPDPNDWRLNTANVIKPSGNFGLIYFKNSPKISKDKRRLTLIACSIVLPSADDSLSEAERYRRALVLETKENATLTFSKPIELFNLDFSSFELCELNDQVVIRSDMELPGSEDDFFLSTRNVSFNLKQIVAHHEVVFQLGKHNGDGEGLTIDVHLPASTFQNDPNSSEENLASDEENNPVYQRLAEGNLGGGVSIERIELQKLNQFKFKLDANYLNPNKNNSSTSNRLNGQNGENNETGTNGQNEVANSTKANGDSTTTDKKDGFFQNNLSKFLVSDPNVEEALVEIQCKKGVYFATNPDQLGGWVGRFMDDVEIVVYRPDETTDHLTCNNLYLYFVDPGLEQLAQSEKNFDDLHLKRVPTGKIQDLKLVKLKAISGDNNPAALESPTYRFSVRADDLVYDLRQKRILLQKTKENRKVELVKDELHIFSNFIDYKIGEEGNIGTVIAGGNGSIETSFDNRGKSEIFRGSWKEGLRVISEPNDPSLIRLSVVGGVEFLTTGLGTVSATNADFWAYLPSKNLEKPERQEVSTTESSGSLPIDLSKLTPQSARFRENVQLKTSRGNAFIPKELTLRFSVVDPIASAIVPANAENNAEPTDSSGTFFSKSGSLFKDEQESSFLLEGNYLDLWLVGKGQSDLDVSRIVLREKVRFVETDVAERKETINIQGDEVDVEAPNSRETEVRLVGKTASFKGKGLQLSGNSVRVSRAENLFVVVGPGQLTFVPNIEKILRSTGSPFDQPEQPGQASRLEQSNLFGRTIQPEKIEQNNQASQFYQPNQTDLLSQQNQPNVSDESFRLVALTRATGAQQENQNDNPNLSNGSDVPATRPESEQNRSQSVPISKDKLGLFLSSEPIQVRWSKQMSFNGRELVFQAIDGQNIDVVQGIQNVRCPEIRISLAEPVSIFDIDNRSLETLNVETFECLGDLSHPIEVEVFAIDDPSKKKTPAETGSSPQRADFPSLESARNNSAVNADQNESTVNSDRNGSLRLVSAQNVSVDSQQNGSGTNGAGSNGTATNSNNVADSAVQSVYRARMKYLLFKRSNGDFVAEGPGWIRSTLKTPKNKLTLSDQNSAEKTSEFSSYSRPWTQVHLTFQKDLTGNLYRREILAQNMVNCVACTSNQFQTTLNVENPETFPSDSVFLLCQKLLGVLVDDPQTKSSSIELTASENTIFRYKNIIIRSETINFSDQKNTVRFSGDGVNPATVHKQDFPGVAAESLGKYMRASLNLETKKLEVEEFSTAGF